MTSPVLISFPPFRLDTATGRLWRGSENLPIQPKVWDILRYLCDRPGQLVKKVELLDAVWPEVAATEELASGAVLELKALLGDDSDPAKFIEVVRGRGYRFVAPVETVSLPAAATSELGLLVGRDRETAILFDAWHGACSGQRRVVLITGEAGLGKTSLVAQIQRAAAATTEATAPLIFHAQCVEQHSVVEPFMPILDTLGHLCAGPDAARVTAVLRRYAPAWLLQLPQVAGTAERQRLLRDWAGVTPERLLRMLLEALDALAVEQPVLVILEDLHWADLATIDLLARLAHRPDRARMLVVGTYRPAEAALRELPLHALTEDLRIHGRCHELALAYLDHPAVEQLVSLRYPGSATPEFVGVLQQRTAGNPLFLLLLLDGLQAAGMLVPTADGWRVQSGWETAAIPDSLRNLIARQIARLPDEQVELLELASLVGLEFPVSVMAAAMAAGAEPAPTRDAVRALLGSCPHLTRTSPGATASEEATYRFVHPMYREVVEAQVPPDHRRDLHLRIAQALETRVDAGLTNDATVAWHYARGGDAMRAVEGYARAIAAATSRYAYAQIIQAAEALTELIPALPESTIRTHCDISARMSWASAVIATKGFAAGNIESIYGEALARCRDAGDNPLHLALIGGMCAWRMALGDLDGAVPWRDEFVSMMDRLGLPPMFRPAADALLGQLATYRGELTLARTHLEQALEWAPAAVPLQQSGGGLWVDPEVSAAAHSSWVTALQGQTALAIVRTEHAIARARSIGHPYSVAFALVLSGHTDAGMNRWESLRDRAAEAIQITIEHDLGYFHSHATVLAALAECALEPSEAAIHAARAKTDRFESDGVLLGLSSYLVLLAGAYERAGLLRESVATIDRALAYVGRSHEGIVAPEILRLRGEFLIRSGADSREAERGMLQAQQQARAGGSVVLEIRAATSLATLWRGQDRNDDARELLREICDRFATGIDCEDLERARAMCAP